MFQIWFSHCYSLKIICLLKSAFRGKFSTEKLLFKSWRVRKEEHVSKVWYHYLRKYHSSRVTQFPKDYADFHDTQKWRSDICICSLLEILFRIQCYYHHPILIKHFEKRVFYFENWRFFKATSQLALSCFHIVGLMSEAYVSSILNHISHNNFSLLWKCAIILWISNLRIWCMCIYLSLQSHVCIIHSTYWCVKIWDLLFHFQHLLWPVIWNFPILKGKI